MAMNASTLKTALKATMKTKISAKFGTPTDADALDKFCDALSEAISTEVVNHVKNFGTVAVASVSGVTAGSGVSGSGTGTIS
jgi:hypothetical protein